MLSWFSSRSDGRRKATDLYGAVVAQARQPFFYTECGICDTPEGRFETIVLHLAMALDRLSGSGPEAREAGRLLVEAFVRDMDDSLREMGVGDLSVPKRVKRAAAVLHDRSALYQTAWAAGDAPELARRLSECIPGLAERPQSTAALADYVTAARAHLAKLDASVMVSGRVTFPYPGGKGAAGMTAQNGGGAP